MGVTAYSLGIRITKATRMAVKTVIYKLGAECSMCDVDVLHVNNQVRQQIETFRCGTLTSWYFEKTINVGSIGA